MTPRVFIPIGLLAVCLLLVGSASAFLAGYGYYQDVTLNNAGASELTNYQTLFVVNTGNGASSGTTIYLNSHSEADLDDLRFTTTGDTVYDYWIESTSNPYNVWVEIPSIPAGNSTMRVQYGNAAASAYSNGTNTFPFFDDFLGSSINSEKWDTTGTVTVSSSTATVIGGAGSWSTLKSKTTFSRPNILRTSAKYYGQTTSKGSLIAFRAADDSEYVDFIYFHGINQIRSSDASYTSTNTNIDTNLNVYEMKWYEWAISVSKNNVAMTGSPLASTDASNPDGPDKIQIHSIGSSGYQLDLNWILIRSYTATEPTAPAWSGESATTAAPVAAFSGTPTSGATPLTVAFTDASTNTPTSWAWSWDDGTANGTTQNPSHQFTSAGTYTIALTATNADGSDTETKVDYITVCDTPVAAFSANVTSGTIPLYVAFTDATTGSPSSWAWSFDDGGANSTAQNPTRTFSSTGTYTITLTATNCGGSDGETKVDYIQAYELTAFPGCAAPPTDIDADGYYEDINGNGRIDWADLIVFFTHLAWAQANQPPALFDFANDGGTITYADVTALYPIVAGGA